MRRLSAFLLAFALIGPQSYAQQTKVYTENKSASATLGVLNAAVTIDMDGRLGVGVQIDTANLSATVTPEVSCDKGVTWTASSFLTVAGASAATVVFGGGADAQIRQIATIGCVTHVRVRISAYTSGTSVARITATATRAASAGGGAATSVEPGVTTVTGCQNRVIYGDNSSLLNCEAAFGYVAATNTLTADVIAAGAGLVGASAIRMTDADTGFYELSATNWQWTVNGAGRFTFGSGGSLASLDGLTIGATIGSQDVGFKRYAANVASITNGAGSPSHRALLGGGAAVASAATLPLPTGGVFHVTGTTNITGGITSTNLGTGVQITLIFDGILTVSSGGNLLIVGGTYVTTANDTLTLVYDGTTFHEISRTAL